MGNVASGLPWEEFHHDELERVITRVLDVRIYARRSTFQREWSAKFHDQTLKRSNFIQFSDGCADSEGHMHRRNCAEKLMLRMPLALAVVP
jgi:hypothetical protein